MQFEKWFSVDLLNTIGHVQDIGTLMFTGDNNSHKIGVRLYNGTEPQDVAGAVVGYVIRGDGGTVVVNGSSSGNEAWIVLPEAAFAYQGRVSIAIQIVNGQEKTVVLAASAHVKIASTETTVDPGTIMPSVAELIDDIENAVASVPADYTTLLGSVAHTFSQSTSYTAGKYVWYNGELYRFNVDHPAGSWIGTDAARYTATDEFSLIQQELGTKADAAEVADLKSALNQEVYLLQEDIGEINYYKATDIALIDVTGAGAYRVGCDCGELPPGNYLLYFSKKAGTTGGLVVTTVVNDEYTQSPSITESPYSFTLSVTSRVIVRGTVTSVSDWNYYNVKLIDTGSGSLGEKVEGLVKNVCQVVAGWTSGGYVTSGGIGATVTMTIEPSSKTAWKNAVVDCSAGDAFTISGLGGGSYRLWCFVDANNKILDVSGTRAKLDFVTIVAPANSAKLILQQDIAHSTLSECYKGVSPYKDRLFELSQNKRIALPPVWENGEVTSNGLANNTQNIRTFYGIGFNQGEKLVISNTGDNLWFAVYKNRENTFTIVGAGFVEKNAQIIVDDWKYTYFIRARRTVLGTMSPSEGADIKIEIVNDNIPEIKYSGANSNRLATVGFTRTFSYANPFLTFERKTLANDGIISDSTVNVLAKLPSIGCVEVRQEINTGCFKVAKVSDNTVTWLTDEWSYYVCRYLGDATSTYYVLIANSANQSTSITVTNAAHYIGIYTFTDAGINVDKLYKLNGKKVAFIGDSITQGRFSKLGASSPNYTAMKPFGALVAEAIGDYNFGQFGIGGACVYNTDWRSLYLNCTKVSGYDVVFVCGGTNDYGNDVSESDFTAAYTYVIETLIANNTEVVVCTPVYRTSRTNANAQGLTLTDYANIEKAIANSHSLLVIDQYTLTNNYTFRSYLPDGLHPDEMGHRIMANNILEVYGVQ